MSLVNTKGNRLSNAFYTRTDVVEVAKDLLGKFLVTNFNNQKTIGRIVETEAYRAPDDKACHAYQNKYTERTKVMFEEGGHAYVYLCYGIHHLFNVVTGTKGLAQAVLIRAVEPIENIEEMLLRRGQTSLKKSLTAGPGVLSKALGIKKEYSGLDMKKEDSPIWIEDRQEYITDNEIIASPRVGVAYAEECALWNWRFRIKNCPWTSPAK